MKPRKIIIAGGTGFIGAALIKLFSSDELIVITRGLDDVRTNSYGRNRFLPKHKHLRWVTWDATTKGAWCKELDGADIVINLCGKSVNCRYTAANKRAIFTSRTNPTKALGEAIAASIDPPRLWINVSSATIYRHATDRPQDEYNGEIENDFSVQVCKIWEKTFFDCRTPFTRKVALRTAITLGNGGVMIPYFNLVKFGLGGKQGSGKQMYSWIHVKDLFNIINWIQGHKEMEGVYNAAAPNPVTNETFMQKLREACDCRIGLPAQKWMLKIGATIIGTEVELVLKSRWVLPSKLLESGFKFEFPSIEQALAQIVQDIPRKTYKLF